MSNLICWEFLLLFLCLLLTSCGPVDNHDLILEESNAVVLEKHMTVTHDGLDGTKKFCQLLLELDDGRKISIDGGWSQGAAPYDLCQYIQEGEIQHLFRYQYWGWYLANAK